MNLVIVGGFEPCGIVAEIARYRPFAPFITKDTRGRAQVPRWTSIAPDLAPTKDENRVGHKREMSKVLARKHGSTCLNVRGSHRLPNDFHQRQQRCHPL